MKYVIINSSEVASVDFSKVLQTSANTLRYSLDNSKALLKYDGNQPDFLNGKTEYNYEDIMEILCGSEWYEEES
tara:strand:+ start:1314 stop:1535 length:222 start_codon:yes stop_codon:yes gene_type:complete